jgi:hypothetical protein
VEDRLIALDPDRAETAHPAEIVDTVHPVSVVALPSRPPQDAADRYDVIARRHLVVHAVG